MFTVKYFVFVMIAVILLFPSGLLSAGKKIDMKDWVIFNREAEVIEYKGKQALRLKEGLGDGVAYLRNIDFINGTIELDIAAIPQFTGIVFRGIDGSTYEAIYFRPQNSRSQDPVKRSHTVQYVSHPEYTWTYLRDKFPGKYEAPADFPLEEWFHVKVIVSGAEAKVYINGSATPCLVVGDLKHTIGKGSVGVMCGNTSGGIYANFSVKLD